MLRRKLANKLSKVLTSNLKKFVGIHKGETCLILGDGPSIKYYDFDKLPKFTAICCGMIPFHAYSDKLNLKYIALVEPWIFNNKIFQHKEIAGLEGIAEKFKELAQKSIEKNFFIHISNIFNLHGKNIYHIYKGLPKVESQQDRVLEEYELFAGSVTATLTLAYILGFSKVYLLGFDYWTSSPAKGRHWYEFGEGEDLHHKALKDNEIFVPFFFETLQKKMQIYAVSPNGKSRYFPSISYKKLTGFKPNYLENYELLSKANLEMLSTFSEYKIYP